MSKRLGFVSTRFAGTDGVSLESSKWEDVLKKDGFQCFWFAGKLDRPANVSMCVPEAYFGHHEIQWINSKIWDHTSRNSLISRRIRDISEYLKLRLYDFVHQFDIDILILENALAIPMHIPLGVAITEFIAETNIPCIGHHHDFYWERSRFQVNAVGDYLEMSFPPREMDLQHVVINQTARETLAWRKGLSSILVPNVLDFENPPEQSDTYAADIRKEIGLEEGDIMILQPTRIVPRKGIERAIELLEMLNDPKYKLVISHDAGDEGYEYKQTLQELAEDAGVSVHFIATQIGDARRLNNEGEKIYTLWDLYPHADLVTYPSLYEGFGNAFLESIYFKIPLLINKYDIYARDIEPKGFKVAMMDGILTKKVVDEVRRILDDTDYRNAMVEYNYKLAENFYSYSVLQRKLRMLIANIEGK